MKSHVSCANSRVNNLQVHHCWGLMAIHNEHIYSCHKAFHVQVELFVYGCVECSNYRFGSLILHNDNIVTIPLPFDLIKCSWNFITSCKCFFMDERWTYFNELFNMKTRVNILAVETGNAKQWSPWIFMRCWRHCIWKLSKMACFPQAG